MSRTTQFIGLNKFAQNYIEHLKKNNNLQVLDEKRFTRGMFDEKIPLSSWSYKENDKDVILREVVQCSPWSSGPMIFTCLEIVYAKMNEVEFSIKVCEWINNPLVENEIDYELGHFWV